MEQSQSSQQSEKSTLRGSQNNPSQRSQASASQVPEGNIMISKLSKKEVQILLELDEQDTKGTAKELKKRLTEHVGVSYVPDHKGNIWLLKVPEDWSQTETHTRLTLHSHEGKPLVKNFIPELKKKLIDGRHISELEMFEILANKECFQSLMKAIPEEALTKKALHSAIQKEKSRDYREKREETEEHISFEESMNRLKLKEQEKESNKKRKSKAQSKRNISTDPQNKERISEEQFDTESPIQDGRTEKEEEEDDDKDEDDDDDDYIPFNTSEYVPPSEGEMKTVIALILMMCLHPAPSIKDYWNEPTTNHGVFTSAFMREHMSRDRFFTIFRRMHLDPDFLFSQLQKNSQEYWDPSQEISIDETIYPFKGRFQYRQKIARKPHNTGLKFFLLADSSGKFYSFCEINQIGYIINLFFYKGQATKEIPVDENEDEQKELQTVKIIRYFLENSKLAPEWKHVLYCDKYYGSLEV
jgi:hypothetical protein